MGSEPGKGGSLKAPINTLLAYVSKPLRPLMEKINVTRESHRGAFVMLPEGCGIEVVATDLNAPSMPPSGPTALVMMTSLPSGHPPQEGRTPMGPHGLRTEVLGQDRDIPTAGMTARRGD